MSLQNKASGLLAFFLISLLTSYVSMAQSTPQTCVNARQLWFEDWETGDLRRWTGRTYNRDTGNSCDANRITSSAHSPTRARRSEITCPASEHKSYGVLQFNGDQVAADFSNNGVGIDAPHGVVNTFWIKLNSNTVFQNGKWLSLFTAESACDWSQQVLSLGIEDASGRLAAAHYTTRQFLSAVALPRGEWVRITVYVNFYSGIMHVWQNGVHQQAVTFNRPTVTICQWHWGLSASGNNDAIVLTEDDNSLWKIAAPITQFETEPYLGGTMPLCDGPNNPPPPNKLPTVNAGTDRTANEGSSLTLQGVATDSDGTIARYSWTQVSGPAATLRNADTRILTVTAPQVETNTLLTFRLTATDNQGGTASDSANVTVVNVPANVPPQANAGATQNVNEGAVVTLSGSGTDSDGTIVSYAWSRIAGPIVTLNNANTATATFNAPQVDAQSTISFKLIVTDNRGATGSALVDIIVHSTNEPPPVTPPHHSGGPQVNLDLVALVNSQRPLPYTTRLIQSTNERPVPSGDIGAFRTVCTYSHLNFDDPIVYPGMPGAAHLHLFFGNTATDAYSTATSLKQTGNATCRGGTANRTAYWVPAIIDTGTGGPVAPIGSDFYYKQGYYKVPANTIRAIPSGLRMVAGNMKASGPQNSRMSWGCSSDGVNADGFDSIPACGAGKVLTMNVVFPQCWNGKDLDSPDHKSHMAYPTEGRGCIDPKYPVAIVEISYHIHYRVPNDSATRRWRLSSDVYANNLPGGFSIHGDWFDGWDEVVKTQWNNNCVRAIADCHSHLLGPNAAGQQQATGFDSNREDHP